MARKRFRFRKRADKDLVFIPGVGRVAPGQILEGPEFKQFCPDLLEPVDPQGDNGSAKAPDGPLKAAEEIKEPEPSPKAEEPPEPPPAPVGPSVVEDPEPEEPVEAEAASEEGSSEGEDSEEDLFDPAESETAGQTSAKMKRRAAARRKRRTT